MCTAVADTRHRYRAVIERLYLPDPLPGTGMAGSDLAVSRDQNHAAIAVNRCVGPLDTAHQRATEEFITQTNSVTMAIFNLAVTGFWSV